jgi:hypothetical protein
MSIARILGEGMGVYLLLGLRESGLADVSLRRVKACCTGSKSMQLHRDAGISEHKVMNHKADGSCRERYVGSSVRWKTARGNLVEKDSNNDKREDSSPSEG